MVGIFFHRSTPSMGGYYHLIDYIGGGLERFIGGQVAADTLQDACEPQCNHNIDFKKFHRHRTGDVFERGQRKLALAAARGSSSLLTEDCTS